MALSIDQIRATLRAKRDSSVTRSTSETASPLVEEDRHPAEMPESEPQAKVDKPGMFTFSTSDEETKMNMPREDRHATSYPRRERPHENVIPLPRTGSPVDIHRAPPHSVEAEMGVLGSMLLSPKDCIAEVIDAGLSVEAFYIPAHQTIFTHIVDMWNAGEAVDLITFTQHLRDVGQLEKVGGPAFITSLYTFVPTAANVGYYLEIVQQKLILRSLIAAGTETVRRAYEEQSEAHLLMDETEQRFIAIGDVRLNGHAIPVMKDNVMRAIEIIEQATERKGGVVGLATGFVELDRMTGGLRPAEMTVIAARPSMGKTALAMNIVEFVAVHEQKPVGVFSLEMSTDQLTTRMLCSRARVNLQKVRDGFLSERDYVGLTAAAAKLSEAKIFIDDSSGISILELRAKARRMRAQFHVELIVVDYLQLLHSTSKKANDNRQVEVSEISAGIKNLTKELEIPVIVAAQLNRQPEGRHRGKPRLSDLRESGSIEQDADLVALLMRPELYEEDEEARAEMAGEAELIIAKQRNGPIGEIALTFLKEFTRFEDRARNVPDEVGPL